MKMRSRKGFLATSIVDVWSYIIFALIIAFFYILFAIGKGEIKYELYGHPSNLESKTQLISYLRTPITFENHQMSIAELASLSFSKDGKPYRKMLEEETMAFLGNMVGLNPTSLTFSYKGKDIEICPTDCAMQAFYGIDYVPMESVSMSIPSVIGEDLVEVVLELPEVENKK